jgi:hypothetical protein
VGDDERDEPVQLRLVDYLHYAGALRASGSVADVTAEAQPGQLGRTAACEANPLYLFDASQLDADSALEESVPALVDQAASSDDETAQEKATIESGVVRADYAPVPAFARDDLFGCLPAALRPPHRWVLVGAKGSGSAIHQVGVHRHLVRVRVEIMGAPKCRNVGESQSVLIMIRQVTRTIAGSATRYRPSIAVCSACSCTQDPLHSSAWNTSLLGRKRWVLFPPETPRHWVTPAAEERLHPARLQGPRAWFTTVYPRCCSHDWHAPRPVELIQHPGRRTLPSRCLPLVADGIACACLRLKRIMRIIAGETVYVPAGWWHVVLNLDPLAVAVTENFGVPADYCHIRAALKV